ncbi:RlpA-like double-psi beta-barrel-protein domain-containing protein-containing protein [Mrakia frigida]|uniref:RlpA-like double-psi beta-barrel domain-containing protein n=1 Tax=Mrakia frigida TaxID=29902 RepID=UPI003FCC1577
MLALAPILLLLPALALASGHGGSKHAHKHRAAVASVSNATQEVAPALLEQRALEKRYGDARLTYYHVETGNAGSCGRFLRNSEYVVAVTDAMMNSGWCGRQVAITANGKTAVATIEDTCPGCPYAALDLSPDLFSFFASHDAGVIYGSWEFTDGAQQPAPEPTPTPTPVYTPPVTTPAWTPEPVTTTSEAPPPPPPTTFAAVVTTTSSALPSTTSFASSSAPANSTESFPASAQESNVAPETISVAGSVPSTTASRPLVVNNLDAIAGLANGLGGTICRGNDLCA